MAEGESVSKWPPEMTFNDNDPTDGYASIYLTVPGMVVKRGFFGKEEKNVAVEPKFENNNIEVKISFTEVGNSTVYEYKKKVPGGGVDPKNCEILYRETGEVIIKLKKAKSESWVREERHFISKPE